MASLLDGVFGSGYLHNLGMGLLAQSGPSLTPQSPWQALGRAGQYAGEATRQAQKDALENELVRNKLTEDKASREAQASLLEYLGTPEGKAQFGDIDPKLIGHLFAADREAATKAVLGAAFPDSPGVAELLIQERMESTKQQGIARQRENTAAAGDLRTLYRNGVYGRDALAYINETPGASVLLVNPKLVPVLRSVYEAGGLREAGITGAAASALSDIPKSEWGKVLDAVEAVEKSRANIGAMKNVNDNSVLGLRTRMQGAAAGAGPHTQLQQYDWAVQEAEMLAKANDWDLQGVVDPAGFSWRTGGKKTTPRAASSPEQASASLEEADRNAMFAPTPVQTSIIPAPPQAGGSGVQNGRLVEQPTPTTGPIAPPTQSPFDPNSAYVMEGPGLASTARDVLGLPPGYGITSVIPDIQNRAAPLIQQGSKVAAQAIIKGQDVLTFAGRKIGELTPDGTAVIIRNASDKAWLRSKSEAAKAYLRKLYEAGVREIQ